MNLKKKNNFLIIGGTGFIGYFISKRLKKLKHNITSLSISKPSKERKLSSVKYLLGNIKNLNKTKRILRNKKFDFVINCGGYVEHIKKKEIYDSHYIGSVNLYKIFKNKKIKLFIQLGSSSEYGDAKVPHEENFNCSPKGYYGKIKLKATKFFLNKFKKKNFPVTVIRFYQVYGPYQKFNRFIPQLIKSSIQKKVFITSHGNQFRDFLFIEDAVDAIICILRSQKVLGEVINIGLGRGVKLKKIMGFIKKKNNFLKPDYGKIKIRSDEKLKVFPLIKKSKKLINWEPKTSLIKGLTITNKHYLKQFKKKVND